MKTAIVYSVRIKNYSIFLCSCSFPIRFFILFEVIII